MGYYTEYTLEIDTGGNVFFNVNKIIEELREENEDARYAIDGNGETANGAKWYDWEKDFRNFSKSHPRILFTLSGVGEESGDIWRSYIKNGLVQMEHAEIRFSGFNPDKLS